MGFEHLIRTLKKVNLQTGRKNIFVGNEALLVWQYVRFNADYRTAYKYYCEEVRVSKKQVEEKALAREWGMPKLVDPESPSLPDGFYFQSITVIPIEAVTGFYEGELQSTVYEIEKECRPQYPLILVINPTSDKRAVIEQATKYILEAGSLARPTTASAKRVKGSANSNIVINFACFYLRKIEKLKVKQVQEQLRELLGINLDLQPKQLTDKINTFKKYSSASPRIFFRKLE